ncbi:FMN-dependent NADH-azoreductase [Sphingomonas glacialis]|uniref:FMN dependent NADH:quinone oxidoreductase n=1 Tax=Sphingomonas glacialis TaxID=658225 RepID=A0A502FRD8_9SPHN|nr:NAD(P)H-dependent oxidoreductase [Sphingomonas glacialis]TPG51994.1 FMN-dependent NADH-azoreductase [Sphingomonas glacialis]
MKLLHLDSSIMGEGSASRAISAAIVEQFRKTVPNLNVVYRDLAAEPIPHMTLDAFLKLEEGEDVEQFLNADVVVIGAGFYNFSIPSQLKAWIDRIAVKGKTFTYGESGPVGLAAGKRVIVALARGNVYGVGSLYAAYEHAETLLRSIFGFVGADVEVIVAEGLGRGEDARLAAIEGALAQARQLSQSSLAAVA